MEMSATEQATTARRSLDAFFSAAAQRYPTRPALVIRERIWSYSELDDEVRAIEALLCSAGLANAGRRIGLVYTRAAFSYAAIIAILRANCVYVPLNPKAPARRLLKIIEDAGIEAVIVDGTDAVPDGVTEALQHSAQLQIITPASKSGTSPRRDITVDPPKLAYIIYTSGSTGEPKGVAISHESACRCMERVHALFETTEHDRCTQFCALSFDYALVELFVCWKAGAALYVPSAAEALVPLNFAITHEITLWFSVPSLASFILKLGLLRCNVLPKVRLSLFGGEALPHELARAWAVAAPSSRIMNLYGPTEVTIVSTYSEYDTRSAPRTGMVPIGVTLPGLSFAVVDEGELVQDGSPGELWLAGDQLAEGYWKNPTATREAFVQRRFSDDLPESWYRTGDLVSYEPATGISFRGRIDRQVKLRGLRIELQEIESALRDVIGCALVAVVPVHNAGGMCERIVAWCDRLGIDEATVKARCLSRLPSYMVPERILELETFPISAHGKVDYRALAAQLDTIDWNPARRSTHG